MDYIRIPPESGNVVDTIEELKAEFFSAIHKNYLNAQWLGERAILAPRNDCVAHVNNQLLDDFSGDVVVYKAIDTVPDQKLWQVPQNFLTLWNSRECHLMFLNLKLEFLLWCCKIYPSTIPLQWHTVHSENIRRNCIEVTIATGHCKGSDLFCHGFP